MRIFGVINVLSDNRRLGNAFATRRKLRSGDDGEPPNHHPPKTPEPECENSYYRFMWNDECSSSWKAWMKGKNKMLRYLVCIYKFILPPHAFRIEIYQLFIYRPE